MLISVDGNDMLMIIPCEFYPVLANVNAAAVVCLIAWVCYARLIEYHVMLC